jgi:hypothetical protein
MICLPSLEGSVRPVHANSVPDLTVGSVWLEEASNPGQPVTAVAPGDQFLIVASIKNLGNATASGYYIDVYYDSNYGRGGPDNIAPGETQIWYVGPLSAQAGTHTTKWIVDPDNQIVESNETNNELDYTFTVGSQTTNTTTTITSTTSSSSTSISTTQVTTNTTSSSTLPLTVAPKAVKSNNGASIDTSQSKFGGASGKFVASSHQYLSLADSNDWYFGTGAFTIDFWVYFNSLASGGHCIYSQFVDWHNYFWLYFSQGSTQYWIVSENVGGSTKIYLQFQTTVSTGQWYHVALVRQNIQNGWSMYQGGTQIGSAQNNSNAISDSSGSVYIGEMGGSYYFDGWLDEYRVSKGIARWTSNFTPPTAPYSRDNQTVLLLHMDGTNGSTAFVDDVGIAASPAGPMVVDGTTYTSPQTFNWIPGGSHALANSPVLGTSGTRYVWTSWADGGAESRTTITSSSATRYTANYATQYQVTYSQTGYSLSISLPAINRVG